MSTRGCLRPRGVCLLEAGADPGFPVGGGAKNCMRLRKFWSVGGVRTGGTPLDPSLRGVCLLGGVSSSGGVWLQRGVCHTPSWTINPRWTTPPPWTMGCTNTSPTPGETMRQEVTSYTFPCEQNDRHL